MSSPPCIAILDDDEFLRDALDNLVRSAGFHALTFGSADEFLAGEARTRADVILTDLQMPGTDGIELLAMLRASGSQVPVIVMTARDTPQSKERSLAAGAAFFLGKPFDADVLLGMIDHALAEKRLGSNGAS